MPSRVPNFEQPGSYIRYTGPSRDFPTKRQGSNATHYIRLLDREKHIKYPWQFASAIAPGVNNRSQTKSFGDLQLDQQHVAQIYMGVSPGARVQFYHPTDTRILKWDLSVSDINDQDTGNVDFDDAPYGAPSFEFWLAPTSNYVPAASWDNVLSHVQPPRSIHGQILFLAAMFNFEFVEADKEPEIYDKLVRYLIPSKPVSFGGGVKTGM